MVKPSTLSPLLRAVRAQEEQLTGCSNQSHPELNPERREGRNKKRMQSEKRRQKRKVGKERWMNEGNRKKG